MDVIRAAADVYGSQAVVAAIDVKKSLLSGYSLHSHSGTRKQVVSLATHVGSVVAAGAGEIFVNNIDRDGMMGGYDIDLIAAVCALTPTPVIASGGAGTVADLQEAVHRGGASAVAAGSMFVFHGSRRAVLINYPKDLFNSAL
jgi:imidazole glycerol-phosphate synthase subunit HisF